MIRRNGQSLLSSVYVLQLERSQGEREMMKSVLLGLLVALGMSVGMSTTGVASDCCAPEPVCCVPPPPVAVDLCVVDPCTCCTYKVTVCVPACCACEAPCLVGWKPGIFGRKVLTYKWSCGHCVDVVITKHGKTIVRG